MVLCMKTSKIPSPSLGSFYYKLLTSWMTWAKRSYVRRRSYVRSPLSKVVFSLSLSSKHTCSALFTDSSSSGFLILLLVTQESSRSCAAEADYAVTVEAINVRTEHCMMYV